MPGYLNGKEANGRIQNNVRDSANPASHEILVDDSPFSATEYRVPA